MALSGHYITSRQLIDEVLRDNQYTIEIPWEDALEWISDAMELIKVPTQYIIRRQVAKIEDYRAELPCDFHEIIQAAGSFGGSYPFPLLDATNTFHPTEGACDMENVFKYLNGAIDPSNSSQEAPIGQDIAGNPIYAFQSKSSTGADFAINKTYAVVDGTVVPDNATYRINNDYIFTNYKEGCIFLAYRAFPVDEDEGFPLIPSNTKYKKAVAAYVRMMIDYNMWRKGDIGKDVYDDAQTNWCWYVGAAQNAARIPTLDKMESIKNQQKLVVNRFHHENFFRNLNS